MLPPGIGSAGGGDPLEFAVIIVLDECTVRVTGTPISVVGDDVDWFNAIGGLQSIDEVTADLWSHAMEPGQTYHGSAAAAGSFGQRCQDGPIEPWRVKMKAPPNPTDPSFSVRWASSGTRSFWRFRVQVKRGSGDWRTWKSRTSDRADVYPGLPDRVYRLRARVINAETDAMSGWSPPVTVRT
jgi:hypothetical protein